MSPGLPIKSASRMVTHTSIIHSGTQKSSRLMILVNLGQRSYNSRTKFLKYTDRVLETYGQEPCPRGTS